MKVRVFAGSGRLSVFMRCRHKTSVFLNCLIPRFHMCTSLHVPTLLIVYEGSLEFISWTIVASEWPVHLPRRNVFYRTYFCMVNFEPFRKSGRELTWWVWNIRIVTVASFTHEIKVEIYALIVDQRLRGFLIQPLATNETGKRNIHCAILPRSNHLKIIPTPLLSQDFYWFFSDHLSR